MRPPKSALLYGGIAVAAAGFALIAFTWIQVAPLESVALQIPYLVSGGLTGLGLVIVGATTVNIHAKRREGAERERQAQQLLEILRQVTVALDLPQPEGSPATDDAGWEGEQSATPDDDGNPTPAATGDATEDLQWQR